MNLEIIKNKKKIKMKDKTNPNLNIFMCIGWDNFFILTKSLAK